MTTDIARGLHNPPPDLCDGCRTPTPSWITLEGPETTLVLDDGRAVVRRGAGEVCSACGHTVPRSHERAR